MIAILCFIKLLTETPTFFLLRKKLKRKRKNQEKQRSQKVTIPSGNYRLSDVR